ncbi:hypothetical protein A3F19_01055 [Candidatus Nomurabacteria bacterium RIFCSPHIGHO2_12_FULL_37_29]|uniref:RiboL-PSP-HEPN domain-containing protein n=2 Tax=Parcubacteria group TaxID=1794811 RepID=A0A1F6WAZ1_9BACT|nr:MAG: hypothetical protein A2727_01665 [Candidatus Nomurabacteria bacterium RIFCSPHIGHO2_01_FULL_37_110]OGI79077.1 MAG: hypothetical protein A3F19_01055 [Candidatus Nomurabacteria bacterium RIFCSPHIGHO2_12_FULL_37_29]OGI84348.1 MAG: hypothetical protein A3A92_02130 [Candidatus Nomurabacteria bacterium RIFCSPLOWO2_01_FULL_37_49]OGY61585.1 MAG: hypothetical protein A3H06_02595 [Candidatus Colwellbacteria bacterium RIFCSPLOWO2_12_FULL_44_13]
MVEKTFFLKLVKNLKRCEVRVYDIILYMETSSLIAQAGNQNSFLGDSVLGSKFFNPDYLFNQGVKFFHEIFNFTIDAGIVSLFHTILYFLAIFFLTIIIYTSVRMFEIRKKEKKHLEHEIAEYTQHQREQEKKSKQGEEVSKNPRWVKTLNYIFSEHPSDWKLAVIEADSMLEELIGQLGFKGETLGEKLKGANQGNFRNLTTAWEVHTIRNRIAHEGVAYELSQHEAKRVTALYERIFREYGFI